MTLYSIRYRPTQSNQGDDIGQYANQSRATNEITLVSIQTIPQLPMSEIILATILTNPSTLILDLQDTLALFSKYINTFVFWYEITAHFLHVPHASFFVQKVSPSSLYFQQCAWLAFEVIHFCWKHTTACTEVTSFHFGCHFILACRPEFIYVTIFSLYIVHCL